jgi:hypothetical protein
MSRPWINILYTKFTQNKSRIEEISFYGFYALLILAKSLGYSSGHFFYKICFAVGVVFWTVKVFCTRYTLREILWILVFAVIVGLMYLKLGELTGILLLMGIIGMKNCNFSRIMHITLWCRLFTILVMAATAAVGLQDMQPTTINDQSYALRQAYAFGFDKQNLLFLSGFLAVVAFLYVEYERLNLLCFLGTLVPMIALFELTYCRTGIVLYFGLWLLIVVDKSMKSRRYCRIYCFAYLFGALASLAATVLYNGSSQIMQKINHLFNGRLEIVSTYYNTVGFSLFPRDISVFSFYLNRIIDNLYMSLFLTSGLVIGSIFVVLMTCCSWKLYQYNCRRELIFMVIFAMYAMLEEFPLNPSMNPFVLLTGVLLYKNKMVIREKTPNERIKASNITSP